MRPLIQERSISFAKRGGRKSLAVFEECIFEGGLFVRNWKNVSMNGRAALLIFERASALFCAGTKSDARQGIDIFGNRLTCPLRAGRAFARLFVASRGPPVGRKKKGRFRTKCLQGVFLKMPIRENYRDKVACCRAGGETGCMNVNFAERAHNHNWKLDPIVRSLLDTDFYKLLMLQFIWKNFPRVHVTSEVVNRTVSVRLAERVGAAALVEQLEHVRELRFRKSEMVWLAGNTFYGTRSIFEPKFLEWMETDFKLSDYEVLEHDGQLVLRFSGLWAEVTMWEIYALAIVSELKTRSALAELNELELDVLYARAKTRLWAKVELLRGVKDLELSDFGTRRRHSFLWQEYAVQMLRAGLGDRLKGTSNTALAYKHDLEAIGTNAHELPMAMAAMARSDEELRTSQYKVLELWQKSYGGALLVMLPDTFGTTQFLEGAPDWVADWTGQRVDSKDPMVAGDEYIAWLMRRGRDARAKRLIASDALDVEDILRLDEYFRGRIRFSAGWGTLLTNDFRGCHPRGEDTLEPISLVCKLMTVEGRPAVKLSDNSHKSTGPMEEIERYRRVFGSVEVEGAGVVV
jgi:nicotinate phosphoribosyltransferase